MQQFLDGIVASKLQPNEDKVEFFGLYASKLCCLDCHWLQRFLNKIGAKDGGIVNDGGTSSTVES